MKDANCNVILTDGTKMRGLLTTAHSASSYGIPVLLLEDDEGEYAVGTQDLVRGKKSQVVMIQCVEMDDGGNCAPYPSRA